MTMTRSGRGLPAGVHLEERSSPASYDAEVAERLWVRRRRFRKHTHAVSRPALRLRRAERDERADGRAVGGA